MAFTLAEVLITLGIIGVVAAMTIPNLIQNAKNHETVSKLIATQSILSQAIKMSEEEFGEAETWTEQLWTTQGAVDIADKLKISLKIALDCGVDDSNNHCIKSKYNQKRGTPHDIEYASDKRYYKVVLLNGTAVWWKSSDAGERAKDRYMTFWVDTNGKNLPNTWGKDLFSFAFENGSIRPGGAPDSIYPYTTHCLPKNSTGYGCAYYVIQNKNLRYLR